MDKKPSRGNASDQGSAQAGGQAPPATAKHASVADLNTLTGNDNGTKKRKDSRPKPFAMKPINTKGKIRVKLPPIESYEKELEFQCEGPGRVVVRLERLMGSNRVRINDPKYMSTLLSKLEEEEDKVWNQRKMARKKAERDRFRQLVIEGVMEPGPDMKDLYQHPVFRVNRILNRLSTLDATMTTGVRKKPTLITPIEPFHEKDYLDNGILFGDHDDHYRRTLNSSKGSASGSSAKTKSESPPTAKGAEAPATKPESGSTPPPKPASKAAVPAPSSKAAVPASVSKAGEPAPASKPTEPAPASKPVQPETPTPA